LSSDSLQGERKAAQPRQLGSSSTNRPLIHNDINTE
jgi:hypothetical protein